MKLSVVIPIFNEESIVPALVAELGEALSRLPDPDWEVIFVNDGSTDGSLELLLAQQNEEPRFAVLELSRNWGHQPAITAGLAHARGQAIVIMDGDLQDPPSLIPRLLAEWEKGAQVVLARRERRGERGVRRFFTEAFYVGLSRLADFPIPVNTGVFGLLDRRVADAVLSLSETNRYLPGLRAWVGFRTAVVSYDRPARAGGESKQSFGKLARYGLDSIFSFSYKPLRFSLFLGIGTAVFALLLAVLLLTVRFMNRGLFGIPVVNGYTSTIVSILFLGGVQLISVGILGEYIGRVYDEVKRRPLYFVEKIHRVR